MTFAVSKSYKLEADTVAKAKKKQNYFIKLLFFINEMMNPKIFNNTFFFQEDPTFC